MPPKDFQEPTRNAPDAVQPTSPLLTAAGARQGAIGGRIVTVLGISVTLAIIAMVLRYVLAT